MSDEAAAAPVRKKKLPFKPTALRNVAALSQPAVAVEESKRSDDNDDDGLDLFRQSREMAATLAAERERKLNRKKQKQAEEERRHSEMADQQLLESDKEDASALPAELSAANEDVQATPVDESLPMDGDDFSRDLVTPPPSKRSRRDSEQGSRSSKRRRSAVESLDDDPFRESPSRRSMRSNSNAHTPSKRPRNDSATPGDAPPISVGSDSDSGSGNGNGLSGSVQINESGTTNQREDSVEFVSSGIIGGDSTPSAVPETQATVEIEDDDDEFGEYVRKAEEQRARERDEMQMDSERAAKKDAAADIMVRSSIPNTRVAHIKYQFDRPLRLIRDSWIALQRRKQVQLPISSDDEIVLTWQKKKVYTSSSLLSLGIRPQGDGKIITNEYSKGGLQDGRTKVVLEAWTVESFNQEEMRIKREAGELSEEEPTPEQEDKRTKLRVKLVAKDMEVVKLGVLLETTVETLMIGFRTQRSIGSDKDVGIWFDGERLEEHQTMEDAGIDDLDTLEVHIK